jgi:hypothetical protein
MAVRVRFNFATNGLIFFKTFKSSVAGETVLNSAFSSKEPFTHKFTVNFPMRTSPSTRIEGRETNKSIKLSAADLFSFKQEAKYSTNSILISIKFV